MNYEISCWRTAMRRALPLGCLLLAAVTLVRPAASAQRSADARELFDSANRERVSRGLNPFKWSPALAEAASQHAQRIAARNTLSHQLPGEPSMPQRASRAGAVFSSLAENVAEGPSAQNIHKQWMKSPPHRANLLDPQLDSVGIALAEHNGTLFAVEDFSLEAGKLTVPEQEQIVSAQLRSRGLNLLNDTNEARRSCVLDNGYAGNREPSFILHYSTPDLESLPEMLQKRIESGKYRFAMVGACPSDAKVGLANYRIAVLLFEE